MSRVVKSENFLNNTFNYISTDSWWPIHWKMALNNSKMLHSKIIALARRGIQADSLELKNYYFYSDCHQTTEFVYFYLWYT